MIASKFNMPFLIDRFAEQIVSARQQLQAENYKEAQNICFKILAQQNDHADALSIASMAAMSLGSANTAELLLRETLRLKPNDANIHCNLGIALVMQCELKRAEKSFRKAVSLQPDLAAAKTHLEECINEKKRINTKIQSLEKSGLAPTVTFTEKDRKLGLPGRQIINEASSLFRHFGYLVVEDLFDKSYVDKFLNHFKQEQPEFFQQTDTGKGIEVSDKRKMIKTPIDGPYNDPAFYAPDLLYPVLHQLLGDQLIMLTLGTVVSLPGAKEQSVHSDHFPLFGKIELDCQIPPYAITVAMPLIDMNKVTGTTRMYGKTHLCSGFLSKSEKQHLVEPEVSAGSVLLFDYRIQHCGTLNKSNNIRPLVCGVYGKPWFRDAANYFRQEALEIPDENYANVQSKFRKLFDWTRFGAIGSIAYDD